MTARQLSNVLRALADPEIAQHSQRFFKTEKGEYGAGDKFLGIRVPVLREQAKKFQDIRLQEVSRLLKSPFHEERLCALLLLVIKFGKGGSEERTAIYETYLDHTKHINNWDLVDSSAYKIVGPHLQDKDRRPLIRLAGSDDLWERRIAIISTLYFIRQRDFEMTLALSKLLLNDPEDLIHKAVGWMLREIGNRDLPTEQAFLRVNYKAMPRTMLRYAIEKFPPHERRNYLQGLGPASK